MKAEPRDTSSQDKRTRKTTALATAVDGGETLCEVASGFAPAFNYCTIVDGIASLRQIPGMAVWEADETRTTVVENSETNEIHVDGVKDCGSVAGRVAIDYGQDPPRVIVHGDPVDEEPTDVVSPESED